MISFILTLFICLFSCCSSNYPLVDHIENNVLMLDDSPSSKEAFTYEGGTTGEVCFCYSQSDLCTFDCLRAILQYYQDNNITLQQGRSSTLLTKEFYVGTWQAFNDSVGGEGAVDDYNLTYVYKAYSMSLFWIDYGYYNYYVLAFNNSDRNSSTYYAFYYFASADNSSLLSVRTQWAGTAPSNQYQVAFWGSNLMYAPSGFKDLYEIFHLDRDGQSAYDAGYRTGYSVGLDSGIQQGRTEGHQEGYAEGLAAYDDYSPVASTIFAGIFDVGLLPVNVFLTIFNFEVFGVNVAGIVSGLLTLSVVIIIIRFLLGGKKDD